MYSAKETYIWSFIFLIGGLCLGFGIHALYAENREYQLVIIQTTPAPSSPAVKAEPDERTLRNEARLSAVERFAHFKGELARAKKFDYPKDAEEAAGNVQFVYRLAKQIGDLTEEIEKYQFSSYQIGYNRAELKALRKAALKETIRQLGVLSKVGTTNRCIWEGRDGCFDTRTQIRQAKIGVQKRIIELAKS